MKTKSITFTVKGYFEIDSPWPRVEVNFIKAPTIDNAIVQFRNLFNKEITVTDVIRIGSTAE